MTEQLYDFGMVGLGVMGRNFLLNVADHDFSIAGLDQNKDQVESLKREATGRPVFGTTDVKSFVAVLKKPRVIMLLVPAGKIVDLVIEDLLGHVEEGDLIIDGGNSFFEDTDRRMAYLAGKNINFLGVGVSGGAKGARFGPSIMPGGSEAAYELVRPVLEAVSAKVGDDPCVAYMGKGSAGNYVKMVHNGIEYGLMQLLAESYDILKRLGGLSNAELHQVYNTYNQGRLQSFLVEITAAIFAQVDDAGPGELIDRILDKAKQKGTGKWTSQNAMDFGIPVPTIDGAVTMRGISALKQERLAAESILNSDLGLVPVEKETLIAEIEGALFFAFIIAYAQGLSLLADASAEKAYGLRLADIARIWRGGCIIRAGLLEDIRMAYTNDPDLKNIMVAPNFAAYLRESSTAMRSVLQRAIASGIPTLTMSASLAYFDAYRAGRLPLNLVQAQRDFFGSHTYERTDREGTFHTEWG